MKKTITITAHNRPDYFIRMLESLRISYTSDWPIYISIEPTDVRPTMIKIAKNFFPEAELLLPESVLGVRGNPYSILSHVFSSCESSFNLYLEEDIVVADDACRMADWYIENGCHDTCLCLCNLVWTSGADLEPLLSDFDPSITNEPSESLLLMVDQFNPAVAQVPCNTTFSVSGFSALGIVIPSSFWYTYMKTIWWDDSMNVFFHKPEIGWDWSVATSLIRNRMRVLIPYCSRSDHIGDWGTHSQGELSGPFGHRPIQNIDRYAKPILNIREIDYKIWNPIKTYSHR